MITNYGCSILPTIPKPKGELSLPLRLSRWVPAVLPLGLMVSALIAAAAARPELDTNSFKGSNMFLSLYIVYAAAATILLVISRYVAVWAVQLFIKLPPADAVSIGLVYTLLPSASRFTRDLKGRRILIQSIEALARSFEVAIPQSLGISNDNSDPSRLGFLRIGQAIRSLTTWVAFPQCDTTDQLCKRLAIIGAAIASNRYHYIYPADHDIHLPAARKAWRSRILLFLRNVALGLVPGAALTVVHALDPLLLSSQVQATWAIASVLWFAVSILASQPDFKDRIAATRDVMNLVTGGK